MPGPDLIYKICLPEDWQAAATAETFAGSAHDRADGFIHFSTAEQLAGTLARYYSEPQTVVLVAVKAAELGAALRYEASTGGALFPHLYGEMPLSAVAWAKPVGRDAAGVFILPQETV